MALARAPAEGPRGLHAVGPVRPAVATHGRLGRIRCRSAPAGELATAQTRSELWRSARRKRPPTRHVRSAAGIVLKGRSMQQMKRIRWTSEEQRKQIGSAMAIATTANLLLGLRWTATGRDYIDAMVVHEGMDRELGDAGTQYILIPMLPFAVELCLKGIKSQAGEFLRTHNLKSLWTDLDDEDQVGIRRRAEDPAWRSEERARRETLGGCPTDC